MDIIISLLVPIISITGTALIAYINTNNPRKIYVLEKQLYNVFLPLIKLFNFSDGNIYESDENLNTFFNKLETIIITHYEFIPRELEKLYEKICDNMLDLGEIELYDSLIELNKYVVKNYDVLRTKLKLPNDAFKNRFYRMNRTEKSQLIITFIGKTSLIFIYILTFVYGVDTLLKVIMIDFEVALLTLCITVSVISLIFFALKDRI